MNHKNPLSRKDWNRAWKPRYREGRGRAWTAALALLAALLAPIPGVAADPPINIQPVLIPPPTFPLFDDDFITEEGEGYSILLRKRPKNEAHNMVKVRNITPGHVYVFSAVVFNHPEFCVEGEDRFPEAGPCKANGPSDRRDGAIPEVEFWVATFPGKVSKNGHVRFAIDLGEDTPSEVIVGPGLTNPLGAVISNGVMDKGPELPEGDPLRWAQFHTLKGGCQGPPSFGPLPCSWVHVAQHLP